MRTHVQSGLQKELQAYYVWKRLRGGGTPDRLLIGTVAGLALSGRARGLSKLQRQRRSEPDSTSLKYFFVCICIFIKVT